MVGPRNQWARPGRGRRVLRLRHRLPPARRGDGAAYQELASAYLAAFPDYRLTIDVVVAEDDRVAVRWTAAGTQRGEFQGIAPTGRRVTITGIEIDRVADGRVVETWTEFDRLGFLQQLGAAPGGK